MYKQNVYAVCFAAILAACQANGPAASARTAADAPDSRDDARTGVRSDPPAAGKQTDVPTGGTGGAPKGSTEGPHEGSRASTPPGTTRDGLPPVGGAIVDPAGAVTKTPPPPGMR